MRTTVALAVFIIPLATQAEQVSTRITLTPSRLDLSLGQLEGFRPNVTPAQPALPEREVAIALHPEVDLASLRLTVRSGPSDTLPGRHDLALNPQLQVIRGRHLELSWGRAGTVQNGRDLAAYGDQIFPPQVIEKVQTTDRRGLKVLFLRYTPLRYRHAGRELLLDKSTEVRVSYNLLAKSSFVPDAQVLPHLAKLENPSEAARWYRAPIAARIGYAIVIPDALAKASAMLSEFIKHKESLGLAVTVVKDSDRAAITVGPKDGDAERIRGWLKANYKTLNLKYVLLIGNPDPSQPGVPMKLTYPMLHVASGGDDLKPPTDYYYADLTGNWDLDGDGKAAVYPEDQGTGGVDFTPELYVGRIPVYDGNARALDKILAKTIAYATEKGDKSWRSRVLLPASILFFPNQYGDTSTKGMDSAEAAEGFFNKIIKPRGLSRTALYEQTGVWPSKFKGDLPLTRENVIKEWKKSYGLVLWFGHGSASGVFRTIWATDDGNQIPDYQEMESPAFFIYDDVSQLDDTRPAFVFHGSCLNGQPESADNVGYGLLYNGAVGTVSSSRVAMGVITPTAGGYTEGIFAVEYNFGDLLLQKKSASEALFAAKEMLNMGKLEEYAWFTRLEANLYGDPSLSLIVCTSDADCDDGKVCTGKETCKAGQCLAGESVVCPSSDPCSEGRCEESSGACVTAPRPDGEACDDFQFCTVNDTCKGGVCMGAPRCAAPGNPCSTASCNEQAKTCDVVASLEGEVCRGGTDREGICKTGLCELGKSSGCTLYAAPRGTPLAESWLPWTVLLLVGLRFFRRRNAR